MKWGKGLPQIQRDFLGRGLFSASKRMIFAKISLVDHLCDPKQYPPWHASIAKELRLLPEIEQAISAFQQARWANSLALLERSMEIIDSIPAMQPSGLDILFGQLHCALEGNWHLIFPSKWKALAERVLEKIDLLLHSGVNGGIDDSVYAKWVSFAALFVKHNDSPGLRERIDSYMKTLKNTNRIALVHSFIHLKATGGKEAYPAALVTESQRVFPGLFAEDTTFTARRDDLTNCVESKSGLDVLSLIAAESCCDPSTSDATRPIFQSLFAPASAQVNLSPRQEKINNMLTQLAHVMHGTESPEAPMDGPIVFAKDSAIPSHVFISLCLSVRNCPVKLLQCALRHSKALPDDHAETRGILTAMCLRALALHYQYNYIYFSGLYNAAIGNLENWIRHSPGISQDTLEQTVNRLMRGEYVRLLRDLGQNKEAESLMRRYKIG